VSRDTNGDTDGANTTKSADTPVAERSVGERVVVARRVDPGQSPDVAEIRRLARAAGYEVVGAVAQRRERDPGTELGRGKVTELATLVETEAADAVVVDAALSPAVTVELESRLEVRVLDRYRVVLETFARGANTERARLGVEVARLRYELPRVKERTGAHVLSRAVEKGTPVNDYERRIASLERRLESLPSPTERHRERRREQGFDLVALAGYTNAGKSTLLRRLADDLSTSATTVHADDAAGEVTVSVANRLFETLETTTRRATLDGRETLVTDTVGFVDDLPHDLVASFSPTVEEVAAADAVVLTVDASDPPGSLRRKLTTTLDVVGDADETDPVIALTKVDLLDEATLKDRRALVADLTDDETTVPVSALDGTGLDRLSTALGERLPTERATLEMPAGDEAMAVVSRAYDRCRVLDVEYGDRVRVDVAGRLAVVAKLHSEAPTTDRQSDDGASRTDG
jgi:GTP-binding protein HflX